MLTPESRICAAVAKARLRTWFLPAFTYCRLKMEAGATGFAQTACSSMCIASVILIYMVRGMVLRLPTKHWSASFIRASEPPQLNEILICGFHCHSS